MITIQSKENLKRYEDGLRLMHTGKHDEAEKVFAAVVKAAGEDPILASRAESYLRACTMRHPRKSVEPQTPQDLLAKVTFHLNRGEWAEAEGILAGLRESQTKNGMFWFLAAAVACGKDDLGRAREFFAKAVELDPDNRRRARQDPDLEPLRGSGLF